MGFFEIFVYPVTAVMKLWFLLLHSVVGVGESTAWIISLFGLVFTVRALIAPFSWMQLKAARLGVLMRPELAKLRAAYQENRTADGLAEFRIAQKNLQKEYGFKTSAGCVPVLIQIPVFLGLYRVLLRMARPVEGADAAQHPHIGFLSGDDVAGFLASTVNNVPVAAYRLLGDARLDAMGTNADDVHRTILPLVITASVVTTVNLIMSVIRNRHSLDYTSGLAVGLNKFIIFMIILVPFMLYTAGVNGPIPIAIALYWVGSNTWTFLQNAVIYFLIWRTLPYGSDHHELQTKNRAAHKQRRKDKKHYRSLKRKALISKKAREEKATIKAERTEKKKQRAALIAEQRAINREFNQRVKEAKAAKSNNQQAGQKEAAPQDPGPSSTNHSNDSTGHQPNHHQGKSTTAEPE